MGKFVIGEFAIDVSRCKISSADTEQVVEPKVMDVLQYLYSHRGVVVSQEQIFSAVSNIGTSFADFKRIKCFIGQI